MLKKRKIKKYKLKWNNLIIFLILLISITIIVISGYNLLIWNKDNNSINNQIKDINKIVKIKDINNDEKNKIQEQSDIYFDYVKMNLIDVDFSKLKNINSDTKGWIQISGTNINYPFVQTNDNKYYLTHAFDKSYNKGGWVFSDYRNKLDGTDKNMILYAHGRVNKTMFGTLKDTLKDSWLNDKNNHIVKTVTENDNSLWQVFSIYKIPITSDYIQTNFSSDAEFEKFANMLTNRSIYDFNVNVSNSDKILTLSTCYNKDKKVVLHAKLIKDIKK